MTQTNTICKKRKVALPALVAVTLLTVMLMLSACNSTVGVGMGSSGTRVGVGVGNGRSGVGIATGGFGVSLNSYGDFLRNGPNEAYDTNKLGVKALNESKYQAARELFEITLENYPNHPDATYYLGITLIYLEEREAGFSLLKQYKDSNNYRMYTEVQKSAAYLEKKPELTPEKIHRVLNKNRSDGYKADQEQRWELRSGDL
ncbi:tetratricopeptide repeat protein [Pseudodesulfovibrio sediminis]|uniref:Tetratricopeptide repeat protein n=1 Tax=Pseudodesulfovibrio sediminis TaxID=2810563 RepID=A0ABM7PAQ4_9BACT|nr:hypothetical protein [Pseudodesulfovibrio sediminis]BCS90188.1 hypothetical protein PSDVSF_34300 [Pseudodesulfovibrio sediminis]